MPLFLRSYRVGQIRVGVSSQGLTHILCLHTTPDVFSTAAPSFRLAKIKGGAPELEGLVPNPFGAWSPARCFVMFMLGI